MKISKIHNYRFRIWFRLINYHIFEIALLRNIYSWNVTNNYDEFKDILFKLKTEFNASNEKLNLKYAFLIYVSKTISLIHNVSYFDFFRATKIIDSNFSIENISFNEVVKQLPNFDYYFKSISKEENKKILVYFQNEIMNQIKEFCNKLDNYWENHNNEILTELKNKYDKFIFTETEKSIEKINKITLEKRFNINYLFYVPSFDTLNNGLPYTKDHIHCKSFNYILKGVDNYELKRLDIDKYFPEIINIEKVGDKFVYKKENISPNSIFYKNYSNRENICKIFDENHVVKGLNINKKEYSFSELKDYTYFLINDYDNNPCLIKVSLFHRLSIPTTCIYDWGQIIQFRAFEERFIPASISQIIDYLNYLDKNITDTNDYEVIWKFYDQIIKPKYKYSLERNQQINRNLWWRYQNNKENLFFIEKLFCKTDKVQKLNSPHKFVLSNTKELTNEELGKRAEIAFSLYLNNNFTGSHWRENSNSEFRSYLEVNWNNKENESYLPYDFLINLNTEKYYIDVKATRKTEESVFYVSINELVQILKDPKIYYIARFTLIEENQIYDGIPINDEFVVNFYQATTETINIIKESIEQWREYYKTNSIRFTIEHFKKVSINNYDIEQYPTFSIHSKINNEDIELLNKYIFKTYFQEFKGIQLQYNKVNELKATFKKIEKKLKNLSFDKQYIISEINKRITEIIV